MTVFISLLVLSVLINFFNGLQDLGNSTSEIELARARRASREKQAVIKLQLKKDADRRGAWHFMGLLTFGLFGVFGAVAFRVFDYRISLLLLVFWLMRILVFNPVIGLGLKQGFFHLSKHGWDGFFRRTIGEKAYYFIVLGLVAGSIFWLFKTEVWL